MRVIAGKFRSRQLKTVPGDDTRPTYDRLKETLFNVLNAAGKIEGTVFLDLFAGTGSIGVEALSRGAERVVFVESNRKAAAVIRANVTALAVEEATEVLEKQAATAIAELAALQRKFDVCFLDPPYLSKGAYEQTLRLLSSGELLNEGAIVTAEHDKRSDPGEAHGPLVRYRLLTQGDSSLSFYRIG